MLKGDTRPSRQHFEPVPGATEPACPSWLTPAQRRHWRWAESELRAMCVWHSADKGASANLSVALATLEECNATVARDGLFVEGQKGNTVRHPAAILRGQSQLLVKGLLRELGLSPLGRANLPTSSPPPVDKLGPERLLG